MSMKRKVSYTNGYAVNDSSSLTTLRKLFTSILINLIIRSLRVRIIEKIYYRTNNPSLAIPPVYKKKTTRYLDILQHPMVVRTKLMA